MNTETSPTGWLVTYLATLLVIGVLDGIWLGFVARDFYKQEMGALMADSVRIAPAAAFYLLYPAGLVFLVASGQSSSLGGTLLRAAIVGAMAYGAYDMTNLATLKGWSAKLSAVDVLWGMAVSAAGGAAIWFTRGWR